MIKNNLFLSTILISNTLTNLSPKLIANSDIIGFTKKDLTLSAKIFKENKKYEFNIFFQELNTDQKEFEAQAILIINNKTNIIGSYDSDGNMVFQYEKTIGDKIYYKGLHCSSSFTNCIDFEKEEKFTLVYDILNDEWIVDIRAPFFRYSDRKEESIYFEYHGIVKKK